MAEKNQHPPSYQPTYGQHPQQQQQYYPHQEQLYNPQYQQQPQPQQFQGYQGQNPMRPPTHPNGQPYQVGDQYAGQPYIAQGQNPAKSNNTAMAQGAAGF